MRRILLATLSLTCGVASLVAVVGAISLDRTPANGSKAHDLALVDRYYEAINAAMDTGDITHLQYVLNTDIPEGYLAELEGYLDWLQQVAPELRLESTSISRDGENITAFVKVHPGRIDYPLGFSASEALWPSVELFRAADLGLEPLTRLSDQVVMMSEVLRSDETSIELATEAGVDLHQFTGFGRSLYNSGPVSAVVQVLTGSLRLAVWDATEESGVSVLAPGSEVIAIEEGKAVALQTGGVAVIPPDTGYALVNVTDEPALAVSISASVEVTERSSITENEQVSPQSNVNVYNLADVPTASSDATIRIRSGSVSIPAGQMVSIEPTTRLMVVWTNGEDMLVAGSGSECHEHAPSASASDGAGRRPAQLLVICPTQANGTIVVNPGPARVEASVISVLEI